ncbi:MAG: hypothetical protein ACRD0S_02670 [Acidimicrobiales bacterium]
MLTESRTATSRTPVERPGASLGEGPATPGIGRAAVRGAIVGFFAIVVIVSCVALLAGVELVSAIGIATFAAGWDGLAMGAMFGAWLYADRIRDAEQNRRRARS